ncbi:MAG: nitrile hydratase subunit beta [Rhodospirillales bacterium]|nr:nitrile hydratase subunit beta [Rhodospirillales bacterium]
MNGIHDMGGLQNMGPIVVEANEPIFHADWERDVLGVNFALNMSGVYTVHELRYAIEQLPPVHYLESPYYLHWLDGFERLLQEKGYLTAQELATGQVGSAVAAPSHRPVPAPPREVPQFKAGDRVRARNINPRTHTRLPRYVRGRAGTVAAGLGALAFADGIAQGKSPELQHVYSVRFEASELWGPDSGSRDAVYIDLYESYVEAA